MTRSAGWPDTGLCCGKNPPLPKTGSEKVPPENGPAKIHTSRYSSDRCSETGAPDASTCKGEHDVTNDRVDFGDGDGFTRRRAGMADPHHYVGGAVCAGRWRRHFGAAAGTGHWGHSRAECHR